jgi:hypothetical protein
MPDLGVPTHRPRQSHTGTQQWQSFEIRMRHRRAERCLLKAQSALDAGMEDEARAALDEARALGVEVPAFQELLAATHARRQAARAAERRAKIRRSSVAAALIIAIGVLGAWLYRLREAPLPDAPATASVVAQPPPVAAVQRPPATFEPPAPAAPLPARPAEEPAPAQERPATLEPDRRAAEPRDAGRSPAPTQSSAPAAAAVDLAPPVQPAPVPTTGDALASQPPIAPTARLEGVGTAVAGPPPPVTAPPRPAPAPVPEVAAPPAETSQEPAVRAALARFAAAYSRLSASAAQDVWPTVDARSLERAFANLESQRVSLGDCAVKVAAAAARAECTGTTTWTPKVGGGSRTERRRWQFDLALANGTWFIVRAEAR